MYLLRAILFTALFIVLILVVGTVILEEFPQTQPVFEEIKMHAVNLYDASIERYGTTITILLLIAIIIGIGSSKKI